MRSLASNTGLDTGSGVFREVIRDSKDTILGRNVLMTATAADRHRIPPWHLA